MLNFTKKKGIGLHYKLIRLKYILVLPSLYKAFLKNLHLTKKNYSF